MPVKVSSYAVFDTTCLKTQLKILFGGLPLHNAKPVLLGDVGFDPVDLGNNA